MIDTKPGEFFFLTVFDTFSSQFFYILRNGECESFILNIFQRSPIQSDFRRELHFIQRENRRGIRWESGTFEDEIENCFYYYKNRLLRNSFNFHR